MTPRTDRPARDLFAVLPGEEDERELRVCFLYTLEERQAVRFGHLVIAHDAVDPVSLQTVDPRGSGRLGDDLERLVLAFQKRLDEVTEIRVVVDVKDASRAARH